MLIYIYVLIKSAISIYLQYIQKINSCNTFMHFKCNDTANVENILQKLLLSSCEVDSSCV